MASNDGDKATSVCADDCRICLQECATRDSISPCSCRGTLAHVHRQCFSDMVSAMKKEKCDICGTHYELQIRGLQTWRKWKWSRWRDVLHVLGPTLFCWMFLLDVVDRTRKIVHKCYSPDVFEILITWYDGPARCVCYTLLTFYCFRTVKEIYAAVKQWIADNTVYEWKDGGTSKKDI